MLRNLHLPSLLGCILLLSGCLYDHPPSGPTQSIDTWLIGRWAAKDKAGREFTAVMAPSSSSHYHLSIAGKGSSPREFDGWISRVDDFSILTLKSLNEGSDTGKYSLYHYELLSPGAPPPGGIGVTRIRISELQLDESCRSLDSYRLRAAIRLALKDGSLLAPYDVVAARKEKGVEIPGSIVWSKTGGVTLRGETFQ